MFGTDNMNNASDDIVVRKATSFEIHPKYNSDWMYFDVAIIKLTIPINYTANQRIFPVCLPKLGEIRMFDGSQYGQFAGFGLQNRLERIPGSERQLNSATVRINSHFECEDYYKRYENVISHFLPDGITEQILCAGETDDIIGTCDGDSGSALTVETYAQNFQRLYTAYGIVSGNPLIPHTKTCGTTFPDIFARLDDDEINQWIHRVAFNIIRGKSKLM